MSMWVILNRVNDMGYLDIRVSNQSIQQLLQYNKSNRYMSLPSLG